LAVPPFHFACRESEASAAALRLASAARSGGRHVVARPGELASFAPKNETVSHAERP
jgi:hypothetical protein